MEEQKPNRDSRNADLDRILDTALAKYAAVEPRAGLEGRILANLRAERSQVRSRSWWKWGLAAAVAAMFVIALALALRPGKSSKPTIASHANLTVQPAHKPEEPSMSRDRIAVKDMPKPVHRLRIHSYSQTTTALVPKLDQFPSPRPLTEQEKMALEYVRNSPVQAALIARAQTAEAQREELERDAAQPGFDDPHSIEKVR